MKLPAVAIAAAFAGGILLGLDVSLHRADSLRVAVLVMLAVAVGAWLVSALFLRHDSLWPAGIASLLLWVALGSAAGLIARKPLPRNHILQRLAANEIPLRVPLRWHGTLREEPALMPWGYVFTLDLSGVDVADPQLPLVGGMRVGFTPKEGEPALPAIHAGDEVAIVTQARLPLVYRDAGAFDRREFLAGGAQFPGSCRLRRLSENWGFSRSGNRWTSRRRAVLLSFLVDAETSPACMACGRLHPRCAIRLHPGRRTAPARASRRFDGRDTCARYVIFSSCGVAGLRRHRRPRTSAR